MVVGINMYKKDDSESSLINSVETKKQSALALADLPLDSVLVGTSHRIFHLSPLPIKLLLCSPDFSVLLVQRSELVFTSLDGSFPELASPSSICKCLSLSLKLLGCLAGVA